MSLFAPVPGPRVFALPPGVDFGRALIAGLDARLAGQPPEAAARVEIWLNTRRAERTLTGLLASGPARLLPRMRVLGDLDADPRLPVALPPPVPALRRTLELARLVTGLVHAAPGLATDTAVFDLADGLAALLDEVAGAGLDPGAFARLDAGGHAHHWQRSLAFLTLLEDYVRGAGPASGAGRQRVAAEALARAWQRDPPAHPVLVAGSTGSRPATRILMRAVARLPQGAVILPGLDAGLPPEVWSRLVDAGAAAADHPQAALASLAADLGADPAAIPPWHPALAPAPDRNAVVALALRPAPVTDQWRRDGAALAGRLAAACAGLDWVEAPDAGSEAQVIALVLRAAAEAGERAALITPDRALARRVTAELDRWGLIPDDSAGRPLALTPPGVLARRVAGLLGTAATPGALLALLKHPLVASGAGGRGPHLRHAERLELDVLRGGAPELDWPAVTAWAETAGGPAVDWARWLRTTLEPLAAVGPEPLEAMVRRHRETLAALAAGPDAAAAHRLWDAEAGAAAAELFDALAAEAGHFGRLAPPAYRALVETLMSGRDVPGAAPVTDPRIAIWGTLEARMQSADRVILGGLNEGVWPRQPPADPWLSRGMRASLGLDSPERRIGLSAHDFQQAVGAARVILTRATRDADAPTVASRWLLRLENLLLGLGPESADALAGARARGRGWLARAARLDAPDAPAPPARRPAPRPPAAARPQSLSVTQIERLVRDPYAIYARRVLHLRPLDPPGQTPDALARGRALHDALDAFLAATGAGLPEDAGALLARVTADALAATVPWPAVRALWSARLGRSARWFLDTETTRRRRGTPAAREVSGRRTLGGAEPRFTVTAKADRIDRTPGGYAIYDYKTGDVPDARALKVHLQLPLEAAIAAAGGFDGLPAAPATHLELIALGSRRTLPLGADRDGIARTWSRLEALIAHYRDPATPFLARLRPQLQAHPGDFDHLARLGEWRDGDPPEPGP